MFGYMGKILRVNLTTGEIKVEELKEEDAKNFIGGRGFASKFLLEEIDPKVDPFSPENKLIFATGPLTGTTAPTGGRYMVITKSPLTGFIASSNSGGFFGPELKFAGYDMLIIEGKADHPVYISIKDDDVEIKDASHLWGKRVGETTDKLLEEFGDKKARVACIGPAGEKLVRLANIINDKHRAAGRSGVGAVMGSKNLKAVVVRGTNQVELADKEKFMSVVKEKIKKIKENPITGGGLPQYGTAVLVNIINENGLYPTYNFQTGVFKYAYEQSGEALVAKYLVRNHSCFACPIGCGRVSYHPAVGVTEGPEYESIWALGATCGINDLASITIANHLCDEFGLDTISTGGTLAAAMELYEKGIIKQEELGDAPPLRFGNSEVLHYYIEKIAKREGFGDKLAEGSYRLAESYGHPEYSMSVKKQELPAYDPRGAEGHGVTYATSNRGGCHVRGYMISPEILGVPVKLDPHDVSEEKAKWVKIFQDLTAVIDSAGLCLFTSFALGADDYAEMLNAATGFEFTTDEWLKAGERVWNLERIFNLKAGLIPEKDDTLPKRFLEEPMPEGPNKGHVVKLHEILPKYYKLRGWDEKGYPTEEKLKGLDLDKYY
ncbi:aldehyde ferredoxin oxidoreductase family protein [Thermococcus sibiricus]|uniref:Tungsten-containing aldehyde ferredoxin oxidoreductase (AOR) n=1 Tax=Thermococcus sibiricus (strain DSM 12597 / MM 739) TaxID=604354 RepID=C6A370_THESM|nr:aldehyde ferredoxin oxidoreductase family protein [Thermococcus sibiricus]ACS90065.1 Tungsten-containing aldehyde ferredoxin oxidoreductase (AOR) [Thermococcus sibiricus MM 739]